MRRKKQLQSDLDPCFSDYEEKLSKPSSFDEDTAILHFNSDINILNLI